MNDRYLLMQFPGVGSHHTGMCEAFFRVEKIVKDTFEEASDALQFNVAHLCFDPNERSRLNQLQFSQVALVTTSVAIFRAVSTKLDLGRSLFAGYSLGEYSALCCAGAISFSDALTLVWRRGLVLREASDEVGGSMMWVVNLTEDCVVGICERLRSEGQEIWLSASDSELKCTISGTAAAIAQAGELIVAAGGIPVPTNVAGPYHSPLMKQATLNMRDMLDLCPVRTPDHPVISNMTAMIYSSEAEIRHNLAESLTQPIQWHRSLERARAIGARMAAEIGSNEVLTFIWNKNFADDKAVAICAPESVPVLLEVLNQHVCAMGQQLISEALRTLATTRNRNTDVNDHRTTTVTAFRALTELSKQLNNEYMDLPNVASTIESLMTKALNGMHLSASEIEHRISRVFKRSDISGACHATH